MTATSTVCLIMDEEKTVEAVASGDGPIDASFKAINQILGEKVDLDDYTIRAATEGEDAIGEVVVKLTRGEAKATGRASSMDIIEASILAYLNGVNKLWVN